MNQPRFVSRCPSCSGQLAVTRLSCERCDLQLEGHFDIPALLRLDPEDLHFVEAFVRVSGSLKEMASREGKSYPTIRNRLNAIIAALDEAPIDAERRRHAILDAIARGEITPEEGVRQLKEVEP